MLALISVKPIGCLMVTLVKVAALKGRPSVTGHCVWKNDAQTWADKSWWWRVTNE